MKVRKGKRGNMESASADQSDPEELVDDLDEVSEVIPFTYAITSYGADYPVDSVVKRIGTQEIAVPRFGDKQNTTSQVVGFQREYVWPRPKADRFIESLLLGLPVPGIFLVKEPSGILLVLDGHQRLYTLSCYYEGIINGEEYRLTNVQERFKGRTYKDLDTEDRRRLDNSIIHATIIRQDAPTEDQSSIYVIFERLNAGGMNLTPQEIRVALYHGELVHVLNALNEQSDWRDLYGRKSSRLKDMELILRFFAFHYYRDRYHEPMKDFLNRYMAGNRDLKRQSATDLTNIFTRTTKTINKAVGRQAFRPIRAVNAAVADSLMAAVAHRLTEIGEIKDLKTFASQYDQLIHNQKYLAAVETSTSAESSVQTRLDLAREAFAKVK